MAEDDQLAYRIRHADYTQEIRDDLTKPFYIPPSKRWKYPWLNGKAYLPPIERPARPDDPLLVEELLETVADLQRRLSRHIREVPKSKPVPKRRRSDLADPF